MSKFLIETMTVGPKFVSTVSKMGSDPRELTWEVETVAMADTEPEAVQAVVREWLGDPE